MVRHATMADLMSIDDIAKRAILDMRSAGIPQWELTYPRARHFEQDIQDGVLLLEELDGQIRGAMVLKVEHDPPYQTITGWLTPHGNSMVIHRVVVDPNYRRQGVFQALFDAAVDRTRAAGMQSIKIDTHPDNYKMKSFLAKQGFVAIGYLAVIHRDAYELVWSDTP